jgi:hypothetical protein
LIEIRLRQVEAAETNRTTEQEERLKYVADMQAKWEKDRATIQKLRHTVKQQELAYTEKLSGFAVQLEEMAKRKSKAKERLYETGLQVKATVEAMTDLLRGDPSLRLMKPLVDQIAEKSDMIE